MLRNIGRYLPAIFWLGLMFYLGFALPNKLPEDELSKKYFLVEFWHIVIYFTLFKLLQYTNLFKNIHILFFCILFSISIECIQHFLIDGHTFIISEVLASCGVSVLIYLSSLRKKKQQAISINKPEIGNLVHFKNLDALRAIGCWYVTCAHMLGIISTKSGINLYVQAGSSLEQFGQAFLSVFFVLSGFLISYFLIKEKSKTNKINLKRFYVRRAFRILPVYLIGLIVIALLYKLVCNSILEATGHVGGVCNNLGSKFLLYLFMLPNVAYSFDMFFPHLSNYWSVGVEEQFYILWPLILYKTKNIKKTFIYVFLLYFISITIIYILKTNSTQQLFQQLFHLIHYSRFAAFAAGGYLAYIFVNYDNFVQHNTKIYSFLTDKKTQIVAFLIIVAVSIIKNDFLYTFKHVLIIIPCIFIIIFNMIDNKNNIYKIDNQFLNYVGLTTYSMYAFNQIFLDMFVGMSMNLFGKNNIILIALFSMSMLTLVSIASYKYIELKFLDIRKKYFD